jgi:hypothetical protein
MSVVLFNELIKQSIQKKRPMSFGKLGAVETDCIANSQANKQIIWGENLGINAGVFPLTEKIVAKWMKEYLDSIRSLDAVAEWWFGKDTALLDQYNPTRLTTTVIDDLLPFYLGKDAWHYGLADKTVLVVHPMVDSIEAQALRFASIWPGASIKKTICVRSFYPPWLTISHPYKNFFDCLTAIKKQIAKHQFDFAVVGAGAYSLPLLKFIKQMGVPCVHLGGQTQLLFGIRGQRWETEYDEAWRQANFYNNSQYWIKPLPTDIPTNKEMVENGCYW